MTQKTQSNEMEIFKFMLLFAIITFLGSTNAESNTNDVNTESPKILEGPVHLVTVHGATVIMKCSVSGVPKPEVEWIVNDKKVQSGRYEMLPSGDLKIQHVRFYDSGVFTCKAQNNVGSISESANLEVKRRTKIFEQPHIKELGVGQTAMLRCSEMHDDSLTVEIEWLKDGKPIDYDNQKRYSKLNDNSLTISEVIGSDSGEYTCVARTDVDDDKVTTTIIVQDVPSAPILEDVFCDGLKAVVSWKPQGDNRSPILFYTLEFNTSFTPQKWDVAELKVPSANSKHTIFMNPWAEYSFRVVSNNNIGRSPPSENSKTCTTQPDVPYKNPENVKGEGTDPTNLVITWTPMPEIEHNGPNFQYRVFWKRDIPAADWETKDIYDWRESSVIVSGQPTFVKYLVKVVAINQIGQSKTPAEEVVGYSGEDKPLDAPTNFEMIELESSTSALLKWNPVSPESIRGHFLGYKLQTWTADEGEEELREVLVEADKTNDVLFTQLKPYSKNFVRLFAYNKRFNGPSVVISFNTSEGVPSPVESLEAYVLASSAILLTWEKPLKVNGRLTGYRVYYEEIRRTYLGERQERSPRISDPQATSAKLIGLNPNTKYRITVVATTAMGDGEESFIEETTLRSRRKPQEPSAPDFKWEPLTSIMVKWQPFNGDPRGTHFFTQYRVKGETEWKKSREEKYEDYQLIQGLHQDTVYEFRVVSVNGNLQKESEIQEIKTL